MKLFKLVVLTIGLVACSSQYTKTELGNLNHDKSDSRVLLIPLNDFDSHALSSIAKKIENSHKVSVSTFPTMGVDEDTFDTSRQQYKADYIARNAGDALQQNGLSFCEKAVIVLTNKDINSSDFQLRYLFSQHFHAACISVISTARINPINFGMRADDDLLEQRLMKLINKALGFYLYKYESSSNRSSVMFGPILSPNDLDTIGSWY